MAEPPKRRLRSDAFRNATPAGLANLIEDADGNVVVLTGAGVSAAAGFATYRGEGSSLPKLTNAQIASLRPTRAHEIIARWTKEKRVAAVATTNVDGLHRKSGVPREKLFELHGSLYSEKCGKCGILYQREHVVCRATVEDLMKKLPEGAEIMKTGNRCAKCGGDLLCSGVPMGGELDESILKVSQDIFEQAELAIVIGSTLSVDPVGGLPFLAEKVVMINPQPVERGSWRQCLFTLLTHADRALMAVDKELKKKY